MGKPPLTVQTRTLRRAADILGAKDKLRATLRVPMRSLDEWLEGRSLPPMDVFLKAVDVISSPPPNRTSGRAPVAATVRAGIPARRSGELRGEALGRPLPALNRFLEAAFGTHERGAMLAAALEAAREAAQAPLGNLQLAGNDGLRIVAQHGFKAPFLDFFACVSDAGCACGSAMKSGGRVIVSDVPNDPIFAGTDAARIMEGAGVRAVQSTPLVSVSGQVLGMVSTHFDRPHRPADAELALIDCIAERAAFWLDQPTA